MFHLVVLFVTIWLVNFIMDEMRKPKNFPNGPLFYPIIGNILSLSKLRNETGYITKAVMKTAEKYKNTEDLIGLKIGKDRIVYTLSLRAFKEMHLNQDFDGRPFGLFYETRTWNKRRGLLFTDQEFWQVQQRFVVRQLKDFGFARKGMIEISENEVEFCINDLHKMIEKTGEKGLTIEMPSILSLYILNTLWQFLAGLRYDVNNEELKYLQKMLSDLMKSIDMKGTLFSHFPFLRFIAPDASGYRNFVKFHKNIHAFVRKEVEKHKRNFNPSDEPRDLIDAYLKVLHAGDESGKIHSSFSELQLLGICLDMFIAGSETTNNAADFMMLHLVRNPNVQKRAWMEIDKVVGRNRLPKISDRPNLPYCEAIVQESLRVFLKWASGIPHRALKDAKLCGYDIPKDTMIVSIFNPFVIDPNVYKNPEHFDPENFLDDYGNLSVPESFTPFVIGKHRCLGEALAKTNLFLLCTSLIQNFQFDVPIGHKLPSEDSIDSATPSVRNYEATITLRK